MKKYTTQLIHLILLFTTVAAFGMKRSFSALDTNKNNQSQELFTEFRTLFPELQQHIMSFHETIIFLGLQPITLAGPNGHTNEIYSVAIHNNEVVTAAWDETVKVWDIHTGILLNTFSREDENIYTANFVPTYNNILAHEHNAGLLLYGKNTGELMRKFGFIGNNIIWSRSAIINGDKLIIGTFENKVIINNQKTGERLLTLAGPHQHTDRVSSIALHDNLIVTGSWDTTAKIWNAHTSEYICTLIEPHGHTDSIRAVATNGNIVVTGSDDKTAKIWNIHTGHYLRTLAGPNGHLLEINSVAIDDNWVITGSDDHTAKIWPLLLNLKGKSENNPLLWIIHHTDMLQLDLIQRAYTTTISGKDFIIALPKKLGTLEKNESQDQMDGRIYFTLLPAVREYLRNRLNIRK